MAAKAEVLTRTGTTASSSSRTPRDRGFLRTVATAVVEWGRRGQLGSSHSADMARYTGARF